MNGEVKKIDSIKNMGIFQNFRWELSMGDCKNEIAEFKKINILYGRNYSGKTTLSRIFRALETGSIPDKYSSPEFKLSFDNGSNATQESLDKHDQVVRVFNEDFVRDNLYFFVDPEQNINSFAILGEDNTKLEEEIKRHEAELGEEGKSGLEREFQDAREKYESHKKSRDDKQSGLDKKLRDKANNREYGIKYNKLFGDPNYNTSKLKEDIDAVTENTYSPLTDKQESDFRACLKDERKSKIQESSSFNLKYSELASEARELIEKKIHASEPIQELLNDAALAEWVRTGRDHHQEKRDKCAFCGSDLPKDLWEKLDKHFNQESESLRNALEEMIESIKSEKSGIPNLLEINKSDFYSEFNARLDSVKKDLSDLSTSYINSLESVKEQVKKRKNCIFTPFEFEAPESVEKDLNAVRDSFEEIRKKSDLLTDSLDKRQSEARKKLRLYEVHSFIKKIGYEEECKDIDKLEKAVNEAEKTMNTAENELIEKKEKIAKLKNQIRDEKKGADLVNKYLNDLFGHKFLSLKAIKEENCEDESSVYRFEVTRDNEKAYHLSEGERSLIAFCYFMAKLEDAETKGEQPIIWIDDPVSSLDANHIFFVYSLINARIVRPEECKQKPKKQDRFKQLFISTHNLEFLKYLKQLPGADREKERKKKYCYLLIERQDKVSTIKLMPEYLREYVTEFHYLFEQIYQCSEIKEITDKNYTTFYNFANNARKFLEIYLYYKYPDKGLKRETLQSFFGEEILPAVVTDRINNEYSHLAGVFERGTTPVVVPEMQTCAKSILKNIRKKDPEQYSALLRSIDKNDEN